MNLNYKAMGYFLKHFTYTAKCTDGWYELSRAHHDAFMTIPIELIALHDKDCVEILDSNDGTFFKLTEKGEAMLSMYNL